MNKIKTWWSHEPSAGFQLGGVICLMIIVALYTLILMGVVNPQA